MAIFSGLIRHYSELRLIYSAHSHLLSDRGFFIAPINWHGLNLEPARRRRFSSDTEVIAMTYEVEKSTEQAGGYRVVAVNEAAHGEKLSPNFPAPMPNDARKNMPNGKNQEQEITGEQLSAR